MTVLRKVNEKLSYCSASADTNLEQFIIRDQLFYMADTYPDKVIFIFNQNNDFQLTYSNVREKSTLLAKNLITLGVQKGDKIAYLMPNTYELVISYFALAIIGAVSVPLDPENSSDELEYMLKKTEPKCSIIYNCPEYQKMINDLFPELSSCSKNEYKSKKFHNLSSVILIEDHESRIRNTFKCTWSYDFLIKNRLEESDSEFPYLDSEDLFGIYYSSGTTGRPKGIMINQFSILNFLNINKNRLTNPSNNNEQKEIIICQTLLMYHLGTTITILNTLFNKNITIVFPSYKLDIIDMFQAIQKYKCNWLWALSKIFLNFLNHPMRIKFDLSSLETIGAGGQLVTDELMKRAKLELGVKYFKIGYGMTEIIGISNYAFDLTKLPENRDNAVGKLCPFVEAKIVNPENGQIQPLNKEGELHVRGYNVTKGYYNDPEMTKKVIDSNGWLNTGDIFSMDEEGYLHFRSRSKEIITVRGSDRIDVYPGNVEECLLTHPSVIEAVAFGIPINDYEEEVCAWVKLKPNTKEITKSELIEFCSGKLIDYKVPKYIKFVDSIPASRMGKYLRSEIQKIFKAELNL